ncbi:MAG: VacJ family lipoprotein [Deltaproteobacteria bacterium]|nr:VacJ family lipoprotein [Deltaproteobacteria bacterium]
MEKKYYFSILIIALSVFVLHSAIFAQDSQTIAPVLSDNAISTYPTPVIKSGRIFLAKNTKSVPEDDELAKEILDDYNATTESQPVADPFYYFNYAMYTFNDILYSAAINPIASSYKAVFPAPARKGVKNFFFNLLFPVRLVNNILQGEIKDAGTEIEIFLINSTIGILGFSRVAQNEFDLHTANEDFGQTLGRYSIGNGIYLVLPILGPSTLRDTVGLVGDYFLTPVNYVDPWELSTGIKAYDTINTASFHIGEYEALKKAAIDPYEALKDAYIQNRKEKVKK